MRNGALVDFMKDNEIFDTYNDLGEFEAFEAFSASNVDILEVERCLGAEVSCDYQRWIYLNLK